jgi:hypothetical protein
MRVWIAISLMLALLAGAVYVGYEGWSLTDVEMPVTGWVAMGLGIFFSLALGAGLMGLMFYSSRHGYVSCMCCTGAPLGAASEDADLANVGFVLGPIAGSPPAAAWGSQTLVRSGGHMGHQNDHPSSRALS